MLPLSRTPDGAAWAPLVARALVARGDVEHAAVLDAEDGAVYASTTDFGPRIYMMGVAHEDGSEEEEEEELINEAIDIRTLVIDGKRPQHGLRINGEKYVILKASREASDPSRATGVVHERPAPHRLAFRFCRRGDYPSSSCPKCLATGTCISR